MGTKPIKDGHQPGQLRLRRQDKVWVTGPGDEPWEVYVVTGDADALDKQAGSRLLRPGRGCHRSAVRPGLLLRSSPSHDAGEDLMESPFDRYELVRDPAPERPGTSLYACSAC
jgi:hypothetical protein